jgi:acetyltransferase-like isoleucine patch superfamily enzyme
MLRSDVVEYCRIAPDVLIGANVTISAFVNLYGCSVGDNTKLGAFVEIQKGAAIGKNCKVSSHTFICEGVTVQDNVFIGHNVTFINDKYPRATRAGSSVSILCGVTIGAGAMVGAGSVVTKDIPPGEIWAGNPARFVRKADG